VKFDLFSIGELTQCLKVENVVEYVTKLFKDEGSAKFFAMKLRRLIKVVVEKRPIMCRCGRFAYSSTMVDAPQNNFPQLRFVIGYWNILLSFLVEQLKVATVDAFHLGIALQIYM